MNDANKPLNFDDAEKIKRALTENRREDGQSIEDHAEALVKAFGVVNRATRASTPSSTAP